jgi:hypothetical protein
MGTLLLALSKVSLRTPACPLTGTAVIRKDGQKGRPVVIAAEKNIDQFDVVVCISEFVEMSNCMKNTCGHDSDRIFVEGVCLNKAEEVSKVTRHHKVTTETERASKLTMNLGEDGSPHKCTNLWFLR